MSTSIKTPEAQLGRKPVEIVIRAASGQVKGRLLVSQGGLQWWPRMAKRGIKISWKRFERVLALA